MIFVFEVFSTLFPGVPASFQFAQCSYDPVCRIDRVTA